MWKIIVDRERSFTIFVALNYLIGRMQKLSSSVATLTVSIRLNLLTRVERWKKYEQVGKYHI